MQGGFQKGHKMHIMKKLCFLEFKNLWQNKLFNSILPHFDVSHKAISRDFTQKMQARDDSDFITVD